MSCSIHLGNYILVVQPPTVKDHGTNVIVPNKTAGSGQEDGKNKMGALDFELSWLRFLREAEEDYQKRLTRVRSYFTLRMEADGFFCLALHFKIKFLA